MLDWLRSATGKELGVARPPMPHRGRKSGLLALILSLASVAAVLWLRHPELFMSQSISGTGFLTARIAIYCLMITAFTLATISLVSRDSEPFGFMAIVSVVIAITLGGATGHYANDSGSSEAVDMNLDWFVLKLLLTGTLFIPLERLFPRRPQETLRSEWREDLCYFFIVSVLVQALTMLSLGPSKLLLGDADLIAVQKAIASQSVILQFLEIAVLADFIQYWMHRLSHRIPFLWHSHVIHHSSPILDWLVGSRNHLLEVVGLRALTVIPLYLLGFSPSALQAYLVFVYVYSTYVHSNFKIDVEWLRHFIVTPRFHHWHHGIEKEAIDVNFATHFPIFDRLFGTYYMPPEKWPSGYGVSEKVPKGFVRQFVYPFTHTRS